MKFLYLIAAIGAIAAAPAFAETPVASVAPPALPPPAPGLPYGRPITLAEAKAVVSAAESVAIKNGWTMVITVVEPNGALVLSEKMDGTQYGSIDVAQGKAKTAANFKRPTAVFQDAVKSGNLNSIFTGAMALEGGELLVSDGQIIGAIGVSGATAAQDGTVARAGAAVIAP